MVVLCSRPTQNLKLRSFSSRRSRATMVKKCTKSVMHVQSCYFAIVFLKFSLPSPSSLLLSKLL